jgi:hypothetical protein
MSAEEDHMQSVRATSSMPLIEATVYRPGAPLATVITLAPILTAIGLSVAHFTAGVLIPQWAPLALAGWIALTPVVWLLLTTVRVTASGIATGRIWTKWNEVPWSDISRVDWRGGRIRIVGANGAALSFAPRLLHNNRELRQYLTMRVGPRVIVTPLVNPFEADLERPVIVRPVGVTATELRARPALGLRLSALAVVALMAGVGAVVFLQLSAPWNVVALAICALVVLIALLALAWLAQVVRLTEEGISIRGMPFGTGRLLPWRDVEFVEASPNERILRLRSARKFRFPGPGLFAQPARDTYRWLLYVYCIDRGVPAMRRPGLW